MVRKLANRSLNGCYAGKYLIYMRLVLKVREPAYKQKAKIWITFGEVVRAVAEGSVPMKK